MKITIKKNKQIFEKYEKIINKNELNKDFIFTILCLFFVATFAFNIIYFVQESGPEEINILLNSLDNMLKIFSIIIYGYMLKIIFEVLSNDGFYFKDDYLKNFFKKHKNEKDYGLNKMKNLLEKFEIEKENYKKNINHNKEEDLKDLKDLKMIDFMMNLKFILALNDKIEKT